MADMKPLASLSSGLLARKGHASPAMRRQGFDSMLGSGPASLDDLGWNDMGDELPSPSPSPAREQHEQLREQVEAPVRVEPINPAKLLSPEPTLKLAPTIEAAPKPELAEPVLDAERVEEPVRVVPPIAVRRARQQARPRHGKTATGKAAFTLRLDAERHLKLRLASALERESAQALVTRALDQFLGGLAGLDRVLEQLPAAKG